jgi:hypothetical protein
MAERWDGRLRTPWEVGQPVMPLSVFPPEKQAQINELADAPDPPTRWLKGELSAITSRAWWEWHMRRGRDPFKLREPVATWMRDAVVLRDLGVCQLCLRRVERDDAIHVDHRLPVSLGGQTALSNLQLAHATCNMRKGNRV